MRRPQIPHKTRDCNRASPSRGATLRAGPLAKPARLCVSVSRLRQYSSQSMKPGWASGRQTCQRSDGTLRIKTVPLAWRWVAVRQVETELRFLLK